MATVVAPGIEGGRSSRWANRYPPLFSLVVAVFIALVVLPSSLNVPQSNPSTTLEFAPVPPDDETPPPPPGGNLGSLGLAGSGSLQSGGLPGGDEGGLDGGLPPAPDVLPGGVGKSPRTKKCVNTDDGPKQTEDPLAPPCVADFSGDNGGTTYLGVSREEIRILFYFQGGYNYINTCADPNQATPNGQYFDVAQPAEPGEHCIVRYVRTWQTYFNERFQTYGRFAHFYVYISGSGSTPEQRKAEAADNFDRIKPFAVLRDDLAEGNIDSYLDAMARRGVMVFEASFGRPAAFYQKYAPRIWGYFPTQEISAKLYAGWICTKAVPHPVATGNYAGQPRKFGLVYTRDPDFPDLRQFKDLVKSYTKDLCNLEIAKEGTYPFAGYAQDTRSSGRQETQMMADMQAAGVNTILWPGGLDTAMTRGAKNIGYFPEWLVAGDRSLEGESNALFQDQDVWQNAWVMTNLTLTTDERTGVCYQAFKEADPQADDTEASVACELYPYLRQLFIGIQVAGPRLSPKSMDDGFHAIPKVLSDDPTVPACFYESGDYTCVKDAMVVKYERAGNGGQGCYKTVEGGKRYFAEAWPQGNVDAQYSQDDPCNDYSPSFQQNPGTPEPENI